MKERTKPNLQLHEERKVFVEKAMQEGAHENMKSKLLTTGLIYIYNDELTLEDIAEEIYPENKSGRASTSFLYRRFIKGIYGRSSDSLSSQYNLEDLLTRKPGGNIARSVKDKIIHGANTIGKVVLATGLTTEQVQGTRKTLKRWGIDTDPLDPETLKKT